MATNPTGAWWADTSDSPESLTYLMPTEGFTGDPLLEVAQVTRWEEEFTVTCTTYTHLGQVQGSLIIGRTTLRGSVAKGSVFYPGTGNTFEKAAGIPDSEAAALHSCHALTVEGHQSKETSLLYFPLNAGPVGLSSLPGLFLTLSSQPHLGLKATLNNTP